eukprot:Amastigsp_a76_599.p1 type:complete len:137 gc:universal Amastigsp_a76_599:31-441(+)
MRNLRLLLLVLLDSQTQTLTLQPFFWGDCRPSVRSPRSADAFDKKSGIVSQKGFQSRHGCHEQPGRERTSVRSRPALFYKTLCFSMRALGLAQGTRRASPSPREDAGSCRARARPIARSWACRAQSRSQSPSRLWG